MRRVEFRWKRGVFKELRTMPAIERELKKVADGVADSAGDGYESSVAEGKARSRASVITATPDAMRNESKNSSMLRALQGRGM